MAARELPPAPSAIRLLERGQECGRTLGQNAAAMIGSRKTVLLYVDRLETTVAYLCI